VIKLSSSKRQMIPLGSPDLSTVSQVNSYLYIAFPFNEVTQFTAFFPLDNYFSQFCITTG
jgi:hypothetical protein